MGELILHAVSGNLLLEGEDAGWMQILVFVVVGVVYALGAIMRAKKRKAGVEEEDESAAKPEPPEPRREPVRAIAQPTQPQGTPVRRKSVLQAFVEEITRAAQREVQAPPLQQSPPVPRMPQIQTETVELRKKRTGDGIAASQPKPRAVEPKQQADADYLPLIVPELGGPDDLTRAILHYEILGKPVSFRDPAEHPR